MTIKYVYGCMAYSLTVDNIETVDMDIDDIKAAIYKLLNKEKDISILQDVLINCVTSKGDYSITGEPCECCGDYVTTHTVTI